MTSYSNIYDAFNINEFDKLDKMAREYNNNKNNKNLENNNKNNFHFFSAQGNLLNNEHQDFLNEKYQNSDNSDNYSESVPGITEDLAKTSQRGESSNYSQYKDQDSRDSFLLSLQNENVVEKKTKKNNDKLKELVEIIKSSHHREDSSSSDNFDDMISHIKECTKCKKKLKFFINKKDQHVFTNRDSDIEHNYNKNNYDRKIYYPENNNYRSNNKYINYVPENNNYLEKNNNYSEKNKINSDQKLEDSYFNIFESDFKNILLAILVGIAIIFVLDILSRTSSSYSY